MIPLPDDVTRKAMLQKLLENEKHDLTEANFDSITRKTEGYSGADISHLAQAAAMQRIRELRKTNFTSVTTDQVLLS